LVDIHSHILPGIDDGAQTVEDSLAMLRIAAESGTTDIVATPHANFEFPYQPDRIHAAFADLQSRSKGLINIHLGCDFHISFENLQDAVAHPDKYTINGCQYLMVELPDLTLLPAMRSAMQHLVSARITPVITHPERNPSLQARPQELDIWVQDGCLLQVTGQSLLGRFGPAAQRLAESLIDRNLVHFIASDAHDTDDRTPDLSASYKYVASRYGAARAGLLFTENPTAVLWGAPVNFTPAETKVSLWSRLFPRSR
jgi:protein-tyrosine phosphatase